MARNRAWFFIFPILLLMLPLAALWAASPAKKAGYTGQLQASHLSEAQVNFIRPKRPS